MNVGSINILAWPQLLHVPVLIPVIAGLVLAVRWQRRHPRAAALSMGALSAQLVVQALAAVSQALPHRLLGQGVPAAEVSTYLAVLAGFQSVLEAAAWALILAAVWAGRDR